MFFLKRNLEMKDSGDFLIYQTENGVTKIDVRIQDDTVWLTQQQMSELFQTSRTNVVEHIKHIYEEGELDEISTCRNFRQVRTEGIDGLPEKYLTTTKFLTSFLAPF